MYNLLLKAAAWPRKTKIGLCGTFQSAQADLIWSRVRESNPPPRLGKPL